MGVLISILAHLLGVQQVRRHLTDLGLRTIEAEQRADELAAKTITVCDNCLRACCWQGEFMCDMAYGGAGTVEKTVKELRSLNAGEHESYWDINPNTGVAYRCERSESCKS